MKKTLIKTMMAGFTAAMLLCGCGETDVQTNTDSETNKQQAIETVVDTENTSNNTETVDPNDPKVQYHDGDMPIEVKLANGQYEYYAFRIDNFSATPLSEEEHVQFCKNYCEATGKQFREHAVGEYLHPSNSDETVLDLLAEYADRYISDYYQDHPDLVLERFQKTSSEVTSLAEIPENINPAADLTNLPALQGAEGHYISIEDDPGILSLDCLYVHRYIHLSDELYDEWKASQK